MTKEVFAKDPTIVKKIISRSVNTFENVGEKDKVLGSHQGFCGFMETEVTPVSQECCWSLAVLWNLALTRPDQEKYDLVSKFSPRGRLWSPLSRPWGV